MDMRYTLANDHWIQAATWCADWTCVTSIDELDEKHFLRHVRETIVKAITLTK